MQKVLHFLKYHNAVSITAVFLIVAGGSFAASPDLRAGVGDALVQKTETIVSIDNTRLLAADLNAFNPELHITAISEDDKTYYVTYQYKTLEIQEAAWSDAVKEATLKVSKDLLTQKHRDLGLYVAEELGEVAGYQLSLLKESQTREKEKGVSQKVAAVAYSGLIGKFLSPEEKVFPGYEPVVAEAAPESQPSSQPAVSAVDPNVIRQIVQEEVARVLAANTVAASGAPPAASEPIASGGGSAAAAVEPAPEPATPSATSTEPLPSSQPTASSTPSSEAASSTLASEPTSVPSPTESEPAPVPTEPLPTAPASVPEPAPAPTPTPEPAP